MHGSEEEGEEEDEGGNGEESNPSMALIVRCGPEKEERVVARQGGEGFDDDDVLRGERAAEGL